MKKHLRVVLTEELATISVADRSDCPVSITVSNKATKKVHQLLKKKRSKKEE
jgi:hypothetical protein